MNWKLLRHKMFWWEQWWKIRDFINPQNKWIKDKIPNGYVNHDNLMRDLLFEFLLYAVEKDKFEESREWESCPEDYIHAKEALMEAYENIRKNIPSLNNKIELLWKERTEKNLKWNYLKHEDDGTFTMELLTGDSCKVMDLINDTYDEIDKMEQDTCEIIVKYKMYLWT